MISWKKILLYICLSLVVLNIFLSSILRDPNYINELIKKNPQHTSLYFAKNGSPLINVNTNKVLPLASTVKLVIAIEYVNQVNEGKLDPSEQIPMKELNKYYIAWADHAHAEWMKHIKKLKRNVNHVKLDEIAKGMLEYSSNANTDYILNRVGIDQVNKLIKDWGLSSHQTVYSINSAVLIPQYLEKAKGRRLSTDEMNREISKMPMGEYQRIANEIHKNLSNGNKDRYDLSEDGEMPPLSTQKLISDRLVSASAKDYAVILDRINRGALEPDETKYIHKLTNQLQKGDYIHTPRSLVVLGGKGGSTGFCLTYAIYAKDKEGNRYELVVLLNNLTYLEQMRARRVFENYIMRLITDDEFMNQTLKELQGD